MESAVETKVICYHCGEDCRGYKLHIEEKSFCCQGCKLVYEILDRGGLCEYYQINSNPGINLKTETRADKFNFLDDKDLKLKLIHFTDGEQSHVNFYLPQIHCSSCIWLLENLHKLEAGVISSTVNFPRKEIAIVFEERSFSLRRAAELLTSIGYEPHISLQDVDSRKIKTYDRSRIFRLGVAGFCFGNIMMLSFPEYFSLGIYSDRGMKYFFCYLNLFLSLPVFLYSASEFYISAWKGIQQKFLNIDAPIVLAILITFARSAWEILSGTGAGYLDSMSGIVFFMLLGRLFQDRTYQALSFERDYKSFFPISVTVKKEGKESTIPVSKLKAGDRIIVRENELIPADSILFYGKATIDYSFVTGESAPVERTLGEIIYAGGKQKGGILELEVVKEVSQSYLTQLWNNEAFKQEGEKQVSFIHQLSRQFTWILLSIALIAGIYWSIVDSHKLLNAVTAVLIVACPCALLLSSTFTNGNMLRIFSDNKFYLKNASVIEALADCDSIVFDKTGTITQNDKFLLTWVGSDLSPQQNDFIYSLVRESAHPLSAAIFSKIHSDTLLPVTEFREYIGNGIEGFVMEHKLRIGSFQFISGIKENDSENSKVYVQIDKELPGYFIVRNEYRKGFEAVVQKLKKNHRLALVSGDTSSEHERLSGILGANSTLLFNQSPENKLAFIEHLQNDKHKVLMIGDGLNDSGALKKSTVGVAVTDNMNNFSPACDAIMSGSVFFKLDQFIQYAKAGKKIILGSFIISILYNVIGLSFAVQGNLSPVVAAILMPISSITIVSFTTGFSTLFAKKYKL